MAKYRKIDPRVWNDEKVRLFSDNAKLVFLFLLTHPHMTSLGAMRANIPGLAAEMGWPEKAFREAFQEPLSKGMVRHDPDASFVWVPKFIKYNPPESPNVLKAWASAIDLLPECGLLGQLFHSVKVFVEGLPEGFRKDIPEVFAKAMPNQEQEQEPEQEQELKEYEPKGSLSGETPDAESPRAAPRKKNTPPYTAIINHLNQTAGTDFKPTTAINKRFIKARWNEGHTLDDFRLVIDHKTEEWGTDEKMVEYIRPQTLFGTKFEAYLQAAKNGGGQNRRPVWKRN